MLSTLQYLAKAATRPVKKKLFVQKYGHPTNIMDEDWDNLLILDACRADIFSDVHSLDGKMDSIISVGSTSGEFLEKAFQGERFHDTVYVSANGFSHQLDTNTFYKFRSTYPDSAREHLDKELYENYHPETVLNAAMEEYQSNKNKRLIVHFMQPHGPYFGESAKQLRSQLKENHGIEFSAWSSDSSVRDRSDGMVYLMDAAENGYVSPKELKTVYVENLHLVLEYVQKFVKSVDGRTVITADHGELFGDSATIYNQIVGAIYEHPGYLWIPELRIVPWFVTQQGERREITAENPVSSDEIERSVVEENLTALGYRT